MKQFALVSAGCILAGFAYGQGQGQNQREDFDTPNGPPAAIHWARGQSPFGSGSSKMTYHGGPILNATQAMAIFWGTSWTETDGKVAGLDLFYPGVHGSPYAMTSGEYSDSASTKVTSNVSYLGHAIDTSAAPTKAPSTSAVLGEVCKVLDNSTSARTPQTNGFYAVYSNNKRGNARYCAWHSYGSCGGTPIQFSFYFNLDGDSGCSVGANNGHSEGLSNLANVTGHELSEAMTDPALNAWYDSQGAENADKCAWTFSGNNVILTNGSSWKIQGNWSNAAYDANQGYTKGGCIDGSGWLASGVQ